MLFKFSNKLVHFYDQWALEHTQLMSLECIYLCIFDYPFKTMEVSTPKPHYCVKINITSLCKVLVSAKLCSFSGYCS